MAIIRAKVVSKYISPHASDAAKQANLEKMLRALKNIISDNGLMDQLKKHEYYVKPSERKRIKKKQQDAKHRLEMKEANRRNKR